MIPPVAPSALPPRGRRQRPGQAGAAATAWLPGACAIGIALALMTPLAHAVLGEPLALPANASRAQAAAAPRSALPAGAQMVERASGDGGWIREYVSPQGIVFAVSWNTRFKPRLDTLLGRYQAGYAAAASQAMARPGRAAVQRQATLRADDLVVQSSGFLNTFHGRAWAPSLVPAGFDAATLR